MTIMDMGLILPALLLPLQHLVPIILGIAPKSHIVSLKVLDASGNGVQSAFLQGLDWIHEHHRSYQIRIVNISIGSPGSEDSSASKELLKHVNALWDDGLVVCIAGGNHGPKPYSISIPGNSPKIITVGSSDDNFQMIGRKHFSFRIFRTRSHNILRYEAGCCCPWNKYFFVFLK